MDTVDNITHLPAIRFDRELFEGFATDTQNIIAKDRLKNTSFGRDVAEMWKAVLREVGRGSNGETTWTPIYRRVFNVYRSMFIGIVRSRFLPLMLGVFAAFLGMLMLLYVDNVRMRSMLGRLLGAE